MLCARGRWRLRRRQAEGRLQSNAKSSLRHNVRGIAQVRHQKGQNRVKSFQISSVYGRVCTTFLNLDRLQSFLRLQLVKNRGRGSPIASGACGEHDEPAQSDSAWCSWPSGSRSSAP